MTTENQLIAELNSQTIREAESMLQAIEGLEEPAFVDLTGCVVDPTDPLAVSVLELEAEPLLTERLLADRWEGRHFMGPIGHGIA